MRGSPLGVLWGRTRRARKAFSPDDIPNLTLWLDPSDTSTIQQMLGLVSQLNDKSGNGNNLTQSTASQQPLTAVDTINGLNAIKFDGSDDSMTVTSPSLAALTQGPYTWFFVVRYSVLSNANAFGATFGSASVPGWGCSLDRGAGRIGFSHLGVNYQSPNGSVNYDTGTHIVIGRFTGSSAQLWFDGRLILDTPVAATGNSTVFYVGRKPNVFNDPLNGCMGENGAYASAASDSQIDALYQYLNAKWVVPQPSFSPTDIPNMLIYVDSGEAVSITPSSGTVPQWNDLSVAGNNLTQGTAASQPLSGPDVVNGLNAIRFDGVNDFLNLPNTLAAALPNGDYSIYLVAARLNASGRVLNFATTATILNMTFNNNNFQYIQNGVTVTKNFAQDTLPHVISMHFGGGQLKAYFDDGMPSAAAATAAAATTAVMGRNHIASSLPFGGLALTLIAYQADHSDDTRSRISEFLTTRWNAPSYRLLKSSDDAVLRSSDGYRLKAY